MTNIYTLLTGAVLLLASCKSASKAFDHGNYTDAIEIAVKKLQKDPHDKELKSILQSAYKYAVNQHEEQIRQLSTTTNDNRWEKIYQQYYQLQSLYNNIQQSPAAAQAVKPVNYASFVQTYKEKTADAYYTKGMSYLHDGDADGDKELFRKAYYEFRNAARYKPNDKTITDAIADAKEAATVNVLIAPMDRFGGYMYSNSYPIRNFQNEAVRNIRYNINNEFVNFIADWDSRSSNVQPDEILAMRLGTFSIGRPYDETSTREVSKEVVVKEIVYKKDSVVKEYAKVYARITTTRRMLVSTADLLLHISDPENRTLWNDMVKSEHRWITDFATYTGDERALSDNDKTLLNKRHHTPPREEEVVEELLRKLQNDVTYRLRHYYSRY